MLNKGRIIKIVSNQSTVLVDGQELVCQPRGRLRQVGKPMVGDWVEVDQEKTLVRILDRRNQLLRPAIANIDQALVVTSCQEPDFSDKLLHRFLFMIELAHIKPVIILTKTDLVNDDFVDGIIRRYQSMGYLIKSSKEDLTDLLDQKISVLCGQSGAGKSTLLNRIDPRFQLKTQAISQALGRGKHTTRHCELHKVANGLVADTPGFSSLDFQRVDTSQLADCLTPFQPYIGRCRFRNCIHVNEPDCAIKQGVNDQKIDAQYYDDYVAIKEGRA